MQDALKIYDKSLLCYILEQNGETIFTIDPIHSYACILGQLHQSNQSLVELQVKQTQSNISANGPPWWFPFLLYLCVPNISLPASEAKLPNQLLQRVLCVE